MINIKQDMAILEAATAGPWYTDGGYVADEPCCIGERIAHTCQHPSGKWLDNSEYIAHFNPQYVRELLSSLQEHSKEAELLRERIQELEKDYADLSAHHNQHCTCMDLY